MHKKPNVKTGSEKFGNLRINEQIVGVSKVRLVSDSGSEIVSLDQALNRAREENLDLVEISHGQEFPVCKVIDYGKYKFELLKKSKEAKKKQHVVTIKEIKLRPRIDIHDYDIKKRQAVEFLHKGDKVKVTLRFKGREMAHSDLGMNVVLRLIEDIKEHGIPEKPPVHDGKQIVVMINPAHPHATPVPVAQTK
jgi:translation initiation factor IF-3